MPYEGLKERVTDFKHDLMKYLGNTLTDDSSTVLDKIVERTETAKNFIFEAYGDGRITKEEYEKCQSAIDGVYIELISKWVERLPR